MPDPTWTGAELAIRRRYRDRRVAEKQILFAFRYGRSAPSGFALYTPPGGYARYLEDAGKPALDETLAPRVRCGHHPV